MIKNYLITAIRFLRRNKLFAGINIFGLSIALAASFIILLFVINELSYNTCYKNRKQIYRVLNKYEDIKVTVDNTPYVLSQSIKDEFPQVNYVATTKTMREFSIKLDEEFLPVKKATATESELLQIFDINIVGQQENILDEPNAIVLSQALSRKVFANENPIGKEMIVLVNEKEELFEVKGVFDNIQVNSTLQADCFISSRWSLEEANKRLKGESAETSWNMDFRKTWLLLNKNADLVSLNEQFRALEKKVYGDKDNHDFSVQSLTDIYLGSQEIDSTAAKGSLKNIRIFSLIAILIIVVAAFNYIMLSTAVSTGRAKEIGVRKTNGAGSKSIRKQLLNESVFLALLVLPVALFLAWMGKPYAEKLFQAELLILKANIIVYVAVYVVLTLFIGVASGLYTSSFLSKLSVIGVLNNSIQKGRDKNRIRFALIVAQLVIFCLLVSSTLIIHSQYKFALNQNPGYHNNDILFVDMGEHSQQSKVFINRIKAYPNIIAAGGAMDALPLVNFMPYPMEHPEDKTKKVPIELLAVDYDFLETMGIQVLKGRGFSRNIDTEESNSYILNEKAAKALGLSEPIGKKIDVVDGTVIGVVDDFNLHSFHTDIPPLLMFVSDDFSQMVAIRHKPETLESVLPLIKSEWNAITTNQPFNYKTIDEFKKEIYSAERNLSAIVSIFALFSLLIASLGLFGLTLFMVKIRTKEIGIKRVFGSSQKAIVFTFIRENLIAVSLAALLSVPFTILLMKRWLNDFAYKTEIEWSVFAVSFLLAMFVVLLTVFYNAYRASKMNPVKALRYE